MKQKLVVTMALIAAAIWMAACGNEPLPLPSTETGGTEPAPAASEATLGVVRITGDIELSQVDYLDVYFTEPMVILQDMTGFVERDFLYPQPDNSQVLGQVTVSEGGKPSYVLNLPAAPTDPLNDVDGDGNADPGVQIWQIMFDGNLIGGPFTSKDEFSGLGWGVNYTSAKIDAADKYEVNGGKLVVWAPDDQEQFPVGFGPDGYLFTDDDPVGPLPKGYSVVDLDADPFTFSQEAEQTVQVYEGDLGVHDLSEMSYAEAFDALIEEAAPHYPFTEMKNVDWKALHDEFAPRFKEADDKKDGKLYYEALRDFSRAIPDGHIGIGGGDDFEEFQNQTSGSYGFAMTKLDDGSVIATYLVDGGPAAAAGMQWGATILQWGDQTVDEAAAEVSIPTNWSTDIPRQLQQYRYMVVVPADSEIAVTFQNPGEGQRTATLKAVPDGGDVLRRTSFNYGRTPLGLPVEQKVLLPQGLGYIKLNGTYDDLNLTIQLWDRAVKAFAANELPGLIIDLRQNPGGQPLGTFFASYFTKEKKDVVKSYFFSTKTGKFESFFPPSFFEPRDDVTYTGKLAVLTGPACASACEEMAYVFTQLPDVKIVGFYPSGGALGEVGRGQYSLPGDWNYQIPDGYVSDMQDNIVVEGVGVVPDVKVPLTFETMKAQFVDGADVVLDAAVAALSE